MEDRKIGLWNGLYLIKGLFEEEIPKCDVPVMGNLHYCIGEVLQKHGTSHVLQGEDSAIACFRLRDKNHDGASIIGVDKTDISEDGSERYYYLAPESCIHASLEL